MIKNPFFHYAADVRIGSMADERFFVNLFGHTALGLLQEKIQNLWEMPLILLSAPGGGKSSLMRIFTSSALHYIEVTASLGGNQKNLAKKMEELGAFRNSKPYALGIWLRISDEYQSLNNTEETEKNGLFYALLNSRIILNAVFAICELEGLKVNDKNNLERITFFLKPDADTITLSSWGKWGGENGKDVFDKMAKLESDICEMIDDPFWNGDPSSLTHTRLWAIDLLANVDVLLDGNPFIFRPLVMIDDVHVLIESQLKYLLDILLSRQVAIPFWISMRKQALGLEELLTERINRGVELDRDYQIIDFEKSKTDFRKRVLDIATLRVQSVKSEIGGFSQEFVDFLSDDREKILLQNLDRKVARDIKNKILNTAGKELQRFESIIEDVENRNPNIHELCQHLRMLEILVEREISNPQKSFSFHEIPVEALQKHENNKAIIEAAELFLSEDYSLPYYFGAQRLITLSSFNIHQFLKLAGSLFEEIMTMIRLERDGESYISPERQQAIIQKVAKNFLDEIPSTVPNGSHVFRFVNAIGNMGKHETYRPTAPYAPGVTGTAITMNEYKFMRDNAKRGDEKYRRFYQAIESAVAHNILEPEPNYRCKGKEFLVLYLNRLLCVPFHLPLQKGGFKEKKLSTLLQWMESGYQKDKNTDGGLLWK